MTTARMITERERFIEVFYSLWVDEFDFDPDYMSPLPWGCPWHHGSTVTLHGATVEEMATNWFKECRDEIAALMGGDQV